MVAYRQHTSAELVRCAEVNVDAVMRMLARGLITELSTDADTGAVTFTTTERLGARVDVMSGRDIAPLLPDVGD